MSPEMQRQISRISFPEPLVREAQDAVHKHIEGFSDTPLSSVRNMAELMLSQVIEADQSVRSATEQHGNFKFRQYSYTYKHDLHVCEATPFPAKIIDAALDTLDETYGPVWSERTAVIDTQDCLQSDEKTMKALNILKQKADSDSDTFIFVNWNKKDASETAENRRAEIEKALFDTANGSPVHIIVVPSNQSPVFANAISVNNAEAAPEPDGPITARKNTTVNEEVVPA